jgi:hypothetical protein
MAEYIKENKCLLAELVAAEDEGFTALIDEKEDSIPAHKWVTYESQSEESEEALNEMLHLNYQLRIRCQAIKELRRSPMRVALMTGVPFQMRLLGRYKMIVTFR